MYFFVIKNDEYRAIKIPYYKLLFNLVITEEYKNHVGAVLRTYEAMSGQQTTVAFDGSMISVL